MFNNNRITKLEDDYRFLQNRIADNVSTINELVRHTQVLNDKIARLTKLVDDLSNKATSPEGQATLFNDKPLALSWFLADEHIRAAPLTEAVNMTADDIRYILMSLKSQYKTLKAVASVIGVSDSAVSLWLSGSPVSKTSKTLIFTAYKVMG
jgi:hypothetical protein